MAQRVWPFHKRAKTAFDEGLPDIEKSAGVVETDFTLHRHG